MLRRPVLSDFVDVINKGLTEEVILHGAGEAFKGGWNQVKLYFMLGLPTETEDDMKGIAHLAQKIAETYYEVVPKEQRKGKVQINVSTSFLCAEAVYPISVGTNVYRAGFCGKSQGG